MTYSPSPGTPDRLWFPLRLNRASRRATPATRAAVRAVPRLDTLFAKLLAEKAPSAGKGRRRLTQREAVIEALVDKAIGGDRGALKNVYELMKKLIRPKKGSPGPIA